MKSPPSERHVVSGLINAALCVEAAALLHADCVTPDRTGLAHIAIRGDGAGPGGVPEGCL
jgi:hypothetical protein